MPDQPAAHLHQRSLHGRERPLEGFPEGRRRLLTKAVALGGVEPPDLIFQDGGFIDLRLGTAHIANRKKLPVHTKFIKSPSLVH